MSETTIDTKVLAYLKQQHLTVNEALQIFIKIHSTMKEELIVNKQKNENHNELVSMIQKIIGQFDDNNSGNMINKLKLLETKLNTEFVNLKNNYGNILDNINNSTQDIKRTVKTTTEDAIETMKFTINDTFNKSADIIKKEKLDNIENKLNDLTLYFTKQLLSLSENLHNVINKTENENTVIGKIIKNEVEHLETSLKNTFETNINNVRENNTNMLVKIYETAKSNLSDILKTTHSEYEELENNTGKKIENLEEIFKNSFSSNLEILKKYNTDDLENRLKQSINDIILNIQNEINKKQNYEEKINKLNYTNVIEKIENILKMGENSIKQNFNNVITKITNIEEHTLKYQNNPSYKGKYAENEYEELLKTIIGYDLDTTTMKGGKGDFVLKNNKLSILVEIKNYKDTVPKKEIEKFLGDALTRNNLSGICISHSSNIPHKHEFDIEIINNKILIYISKCNKNIAIINYAIKIIELIENHNKQQNQNSDKSKLIIDETFYTVLQNEYSYLKNTLEEARQASKKVINLLDKAVSQNLENFLKFKILQLPGILACDKCPKICKNQSGFTRHMKKHRDDKKENNEAENNDTEDNENEVEKNNTEDNETESDENEEDNTNEIEEKDDEPESEEDNKFIEIKKNNKNSKKEINKVV